MVSLKGAIVGFPLLKAAVMTGAVAALASAEPFWHQLLLVIISASVSGIGMVLAALVGSRRIEQKIDDTHDAVTDIKQSVGLDKRASDEHTDAQ